MEEAYGLIIKIYKNGCLRRLDLKEAANEQFGFLLKQWIMVSHHMEDWRLAWTASVMLLAGEDNIREVIAFPKNNKATDPMTQAPSVVSENNWMS